MAQSQNLLLCLYVAPAFHRRKMESVTEQQYNEKKQVN